MSERLNKIADEILTVVNKKRISGETPEKDYWIATYLPNREQINVIFRDREVSGSYVQKRFKKDDRDSIIAELEKLYGKEPRNHNEEELGEDTVYDHSWYEVKKQKYPRRTKEGVMIKEEDLEETCSGCATGAEAVCNTPTPVGSVRKSISRLTKTASPVKHKRKKVSEDIHSKLIKESILNEMPCEAEVEGHQFKYFMYEGKWYLSVDNCLVKTHDKGVMMETFDQIVDNEKVTTSLLEDYSCFEMELLMEEESQENDNINQVNGGKENSLDYSDDMKNDIGKVSSDLMDLEKKNNNNEPEKQKTTDQINNQIKHDNEVIKSQNEEGVIYDKKGEPEKVTIVGDVDTNISNNNNITVNSPIEKKLVRYRDSSGKEHITDPKYLNKIQ